MPTQADNYFVFAGKVYARNAPAPQAERVYAIADAVQGLPQQAMHLTPLVVASCSLAFVLWEALQLSHSHKLPRPFGAAAAAAARAEAAGAAVGSNDAQLAHHRPEIWPCGDGQSVHAASLSEPGALKKTLRDLTKALSSNASLQDAVAVNAARQTLLWEAEQAGTLSSMTLESLKASKALSGPGLDALELLEPALPDVALTRLVLSLPLRVPARAPCASCNAPQARAVAVSAAHRTALAKALGGEPRGQAWLRALVLACVCAGAMGPGVDEGVLQPPSATWWQQQPEEQTPSTCLLWEEGRWAGPFPFRTRLPLRWTRESGVPSLAARIARLAGGGRTAVLAKDGRMFAADRRLQACQVCVDLSRSAVYFRQDLDPQARRRVLAWLRIDHATTPQSGDEADASQSRPSALDDYHAFPACFALCVDEAEEFRGPNLEHGGASFVVGVDVDLPAAKRGLVLLCRDRSLCPCDLLG